MHADSPAVLWDALHAGRLVQRFVGGTTFDAYDTDDLMRSAVERQLGIVGEALREHVVAFACGPTGRGSTEADEAERALPWKLVGELVE